MRRDAHFVYDTIGDVEKFYQDHRYSDPRAVYWSCVRLVRNWRGQPRNYDHWERILQIALGLQEIFEQGYGEDSEEHAKYLKNKVILEIGMVVNEGRLELGFLEYQRHQAS